MKKITLIILLIFICLFLYGNYIEVNNIKVKYFELNNEGVPDDIQDLKIVHFSDILYNPKNNNKMLDKVLEKINNENPDVVIFSGDLFKKGISYSEDDYNKIKDFLTKINASLYKYAVIGDNDLEYAQKYQDILYDADFKLLNNEAMLFFYKDITPINIIGISDTSKLEELLKSDIEYNYSIVITHKPDNLDVLSNYNVNTVFSGHSLGGVINIPYYGGLIKKDGAKKYVNSKYTLNSTTMFISNGIGNEKWNFRLFNTPSINVYSFKK